MARHSVFNLSRPKKSLMLLAPLAPEAGGYGICRDDAGMPVFESADDTDYHAILAMCVAGSRRLGEIRRFDMADFRPPEPYLREMTRYGILPDVPGPGKVVDPYELDQAYWRMMWWRPDVVARGGGVGH